MLKEYPFIKNIRTAIVSLSTVTMLISTASMAQQWDLQSSVQQAISTSPELQKSFAVINSRQIDIGLARLWPDPQIGFRIDNQLGQDDGSGGYDLTDITVSQAIPVNRIKYQNSVAEANLKAAQFAKQHETLQVQNRVSKVFHQLQFASAKFSLAEQQVKLADQLKNQSKKSKRSNVVRYLTPLELMRLSIIKEEARQAVSNAEGKYHEALTEFAKLLVIDIEAVSSVSELMPITFMPDIQNLTILQASHAQLSSQQQQLLAAKHEIDVARNSQLVDPSVALSWSRDTFDQGRDDVYAVMLNLQIPLSDRRQKAASKASYKASQHRIDLELLERELKINLHRSFAHLNHIVEQTSDYKKKVLLPAKKILNLTNKGFTSGELNILSVVDANKIYFEARLNYLDLLYQSHVELAEVNLFSGQLLSGIETKAVSLNKVGE